MSTSGYLMGRTPGETARLVAQGELYAEATSHLLARAGIGPGMSVLDVGCGAGDVAVAAARLVGESGRVLAVDSNPEILADARSRAGAANAPGIEFRTGTLPDLDLEEPVDAVVGRLILLHVREPSAFVRRLAPLVRDGGIVTFLELAIDEMTSLPPTPLFTTTLGTAITTMTAAGVDPAMGRRLPRLLADAGLATPDAAGYEPVAFGEESVSAAARYLAGSFTSMLPAARRFGVATDGELDPATLADRLSAELLGASATVLLPPMVAAWGSVRRGGVRPDGRAEPGGRLVT